MGEARRRRIHVPQQAGVRQLGLQRRLQEALDLVEADAAQGDQPADDLGQAETLGDGQPEPLGIHAAAATTDPAPSGDRPRSEEHTSELQSLMRNSYAVFCLKKKKKNNEQKLNHTTRN